MLRRGREAAANRFNRESQRGEGAPTWAGVFRTWEVACEHICPSLLQPLEFVEVAVNIPHAELRDNIVEWWPRRHYQHRKDWLTQARSRTWRIETGVSNTVEMLWHSRSDAASVAAIYIAACMFSWRDNPSRVDDFFWSLQGLVFDVLREKGYDGWHHRTRAPLPGVSVFHQLNDSLVLRSVHDLVYTAAIDAALIEAQYIRVHVVSNEDAAA
jgi:hypothetical protein